jgi:hypothetical protein
VSPNDESESIGVCDDEGRQVLFPRWYHSHAMAITDLSKSTYSGEFGFLIVEPAAGDPGSYDREVLLAAHHWDGHWELALHRIKSAIAVAVRSLRDDRVLIQAPSKEF